MLEDINEVHSVQEPTEPDKLVKPVRWEDSIESKLVKESTERVRINKNFCFAR